MRKKSIGAQNARSTYKERPKDNILKSGQRARDMKNGGKNGGMGRGRPGVSKSQDGGREGAGRRVPMRLGTNMPCMCKRAMERKKKSP